ncbi:MAG: TorD/DmsD family molecular chaperone [Acidimicrobiia bacterium]
MNGTAELFRVLGALCEPPDRAHRPAIAALGLGGQASAAEHTELFVLQLPPYAAIYLGPEGMLGGEAGDRVAGFWRALQLVPSADADHLTALLSLYAAVCEREEAETRPPVRALLHQARQALLWEHLVSWVPAYGRAVETIGPPPYRAWARLLVEVVTGEARGLGPQPDLSAHLRQAPVLPGPDEGGGAWLSALLTPVRSGLILTRADLVRAGRLLGIGARVGDRRLVLEAMLGQDPAGMLRWLGTEADGWARYHRQAEPALGGVARFWAERAETTAANLRVGCPG